MQVESATEIEKLSPPEAFRANIRFSGGAMAAVLATASDGGVGREATERGGSGSCMKELILNEGFP